MQFSDSGFAPYDVAIKSVDEIGWLFQQIPGSAIVLRYIRSSYQNDPIRSAVELLLFLFAIRYLLAPSYSVNKQNIQLTEEEIDGLVEDWTPEPMTATLTELEQQELEKRPVIVGPTGPKSKLTNGKTVTNLASYNFYNFIANETVKEKAIETLRLYGVGPCGPPGFYGTQDVHIKTEAEVAAFLGVPQCIIYAQAFSTISSVIPAFAKRGDVIVADEACNFAIRKGLQISRSIIRWYKHNDMEDLERVLASVAREQARKRVTRRFIVTEGLFDSLGDISDLPCLIELKQRYKFRLILDETWSFAVLGKTGRGLTEAQNVDPNTVDAIVGSLAGPLCAAGGFCAGTEEVVEHQRIMSTAYVFSAALPAMMSTTARETLRLLQDEPAVLTQLRENIMSMWAQLDPRSDWVTCTSSPLNPIMLLVLKREVVEARNLAADDDQARLLQECVDEALANGVLVTRVKGMPAAQNAIGSGKTVDWRARPALKVCLTVGLTRKEVEKAGTVIRHAITKVMSRRR